MRSYRLLFIALALILCLHSVTAAPNAAAHLARRQDDNRSESSEKPTATSDRSSQQSPTATPQSSPITRSERSTTTTPSSVPSESVTETPATTTSNDDQPSPTSSAGEIFHSVEKHDTDFARPEANSQPQLPLQPKITPAFGLAGAIFLLSGLVYAVIGIKNQWYVN